MSVEPQNAAGVDDQQVKGAVQPKLILWLLVSGGELKLPYQLEKNSGPPMQPLVN